MDELIVLLDEAGRIIGSAPKLASHHADTPLHQGFSCYIFDDDGKLLLTRRADTKKVWPGVWTKSVCGHPLPDETTEDAVLRRAGYELGVTALTELQLILPDYRYRTPSFNGIIENEYCPVFAARLASDIGLNPAEVGDYQWTSLPDLQSDIAVRPEAYFSYWLKDQLPRLMETAAFHAYTIPR